jgi:hypothetical protein
MSEAKSQVENSSVGENGIYSPSNLNNLTAPRLATLAARVETWKADAANADMLTSLSLQGALAVAPYGGGGLAKAAPGAQAVQLTARTIRPSEGMRIIDQLRKALSFKKSGNIAYAEVSITNGVSGRLVAHSGDGARAGTVGLPKQTRFATEATGKNTRELDSERKLLEGLAARLQPDAQGVVRLFSERPMCPSCMKVVEQFREAFPGIKVVISSGAKK